MKHTTLFQNLAEIISPYPINDLNNPLKDLVHYCPVVELPKKLTCNHSDYHEIEGVLIDGYYYLVTYLGEVTEDCQDFTITIGKIERAEANDIDSEYQRIFKIEKRIYDQILKEASDDYDEYWFEDDAENERECQQDIRDDLRINQDYD